MSNALIRIIAFRGEHGELNGTRLLQSRLGSYSFGTLRAAKHYAQNPNNFGDVIKNPRIIKAEITIKRPIINSPKDPFLEFSEIERSIGLDKAVHIAKMLDIHIFNTDNWNRIKIDREVNCNIADDRKYFNAWLKKDPSGLLSEIYVDAYKVLDETDWVNWFKEKGFDGAIHGGNGETACEPEYKVFDQSQVHILSSTCLETSLLDSNPVYNP